MIKIYTDGSCIGNPGAGGWAAIILDGKNEKIISGNKNNTTNNQMELFAAIKALSNFNKKKSFKIFTDSNDDLNVKEKMKNLKEQKFFKIDNNQLKSIKHDFVSESLSEKETQNFIKNFYNKFNVILDPHTAVGYGVLNKISSEGINVVLATAHPCKFPEAINKAIGLKPNLPKELDYIMSAKENYDLIPNNLDKIKNHILEKI